MVTAIILTVSFLLTGFLILKLLKLERQAEKEIISRTTAVIERDLSFKDNEELIRDKERLASQISSLEAINNHLSNKGKDLEKDITRLNTKIFQLEDLVDTGYKQIEALKNEVAALENPPVLVTSDPEPVAVKPAVKKRVRAKK
jgi:peptidoglycan hydrolase CwlO-like protein